MRLMIFVFRYCTALVHYPKNNVHVFLYLTVQKRACGKIQGCLSKSFFIHADFMISSVFRLFCMLSLITLADIFFNIFRFRNEMAPVVKKL